MAIDFSSVIKKNHRLLIRAIDPNESLISSLRIYDVLSTEEVEKVMLLPSADDRNYKLLMHLLGMAVSQEVMRTFVDTLRSCDQEHVANIFEMRSEKLPMSDAHFNVLVNNKSKIEIILDPDCGLLSRLTDSQSFTRYDVQRINSAATNNEKASAIIEALLRKSDCTFDRFISALQESSQEHVAFVLTGKGSPPIRADLIQNMEDNWDEIVKSMDAKDSELLDSLVSGKVLNRSDYDRVDPSSGQNTASNMNVELLRIIPRRSQVAFDRFIVSLVATRQSHIAALFVGFVGDKLVNAKLIITFRDGVDAATRQYVEDTLKIKLSDAIGDGLRFQSEIFTRKIRNILQVDYVRDGCIAIGFKCATLEALQMFRKVHETGEFDSAFTDTYQPMFADAGMLSISLQITAEEFDRCSTKFQENTLMTPAHRQALLLAAKSKYAAEKLVVTDEVVNQLELCDRRKQAIREAPVGCRSATLLNIVSRRPDSTFAQLQHVLRQTGHDDLVHFLNEPNLYEVREKEHVGELEVRASPEAIPSGSSTLEGIEPCKKRRLRDVGKAPTKRTKRDEDKTRSFMTSGTHTTILDFGGMQSEVTFPVENARAFRRATILQAEAQSGVADLMSHCIRLQEKLGRGAREMSMLQSTITLRPQPPHQKLQQSRTTQTDDDFVSLPPTCNFSRLPAELLEMVLMKVLVKECWDAWRSVVSSEDLYFYGRSGKAGNLIFVRLVPSRYIKVASVCSWWRQTLTGWPASSSPHWFRHKLRRELSRYCRESLIIKVYDVKDSLQNLLEPCYGLIEECTALGVLSQNETIQLMIHSIQEPKRQNSQILSLLLKNPTEQRFRDFLLALQQTDQQHLVNFIKCRGDSIEKFGDIRPLDTSRTESLNSRRKRLTEIIVSNETLLSSLLKAGCINQRMYDTLLATNEAYDRNAKLLDILLKRSIADYEMFIKCIEKNNESHVSQLLLKDTAGAEEWYETDSFYHVVNTFNEAHALRYEHIADAKETHERFVKVIETSLRVIGVCQRLEYTGTLYEDTAIKMTPDIRHLKFEVLAVVTGCDRLYATCIPGCPGYATLHSREPEAVGTLCLPEEAFKGFFDALQKCVNNSDELKFRTILRHHGPTSIFMDVLRESGNETTTVSMPTSPNFTVCFIPCYEVDSNMYIVKPRAAVEGGFRMSWRTCFSLSEKRELSSMNDPTDCRKKVLTVVYAIRNIAADLRALSFYHFKMAAFLIFQTNRSKRHWSLDRIGPRVIDVLKKLEECLDQGFMSLPHLPDVNLLQNMSPASTDVLKARLHQLINSATVLTELMQSSHNVLFYHVGIARSNCTVSLGDANEDDDYY